MSERVVTVAATQMACGPERAANVEAAEELIRDAAGQGAQIILLQELYETPYFPIDERTANFELALPARDHPTLKRMSDLAAELEVVLPVSFFERANNAHFNALAVIDADGRQVGHYRKSHIPHGFGYQEKFYFNPGDTGFQAFETRYATIGAAICWDQWFPEAARAMCLKGAEILFYPTAIGSILEGEAPDSQPAWQRAMQGHAVCNAVPVVASNRVGREQGDRGAIDFYGTSFVADHCGALLGQAGRDQREIVVARVDLAETRRHRAGFGFFRDRRVDVYGDLLALGGS